jgi:hypothetical protein
MLWYLVAVTLPVRIDAQKDPIGPILAFAFACVVLWFLVSQARRRDARRARGRDLSGWRSRQPPRY